MAAAECTAGTPELRKAKADRPDSEQRRGFAGHKGEGKNSGKTPELLRNLSGNPFRHRCRVDPHSLEHCPGLKRRAKFIPARRRNRARGG